MHVDSLFPQVALGHHMIWSFFIWKNWYVARAWCQHSFKLCCSFLAPWVYDASGRSVQWGRPTVSCLVELPIPGKGLRCCLKASGMGRKLVWWQCNNWFIILWSIHSHELYDTLGFVFEEPQLPSDGGVPCSTCCSHLALMVTVAYQHPNCDREHYGTDSLKQHPRSATHVGVVYFSSLHHVRHGCSWAFYALVSEWKVVVLDWS